MFIACVFYKLVRPCQEMCAGPQIQFETQALIGCRDQQGCGKINAEKSTKSGDIWWKNSVFNAKIGKYSNIFYLSISLVASLHTNTSLCTEYS